MSIVNEIESIYDFLKSVFPSQKVWFQRVPSEVKPNEISIRYITGNSTRETGYHYRLDHDFQIAYFADNDLECITKMSELEKTLSSAISIPLKDSDRYMYVDSFSNSQSFKTESGNFAIIGVLSVHVREAQPQAIETKINNVNARYE